MASGSATLRFDPLKTWRVRRALHRTEIAHRPAGGRGASVSACADFTNQLLSCWVDPRICLDKNTDTAIVGDGWTGVVGHHDLYY